LKKNGSSFAADSRARLVSMDGRWSVSVGDVDGVAVSDWTASSSANRARVAPSADASDAAVSTRLASPSGDAGESGDCLPIRRLSRITRSNAFFCCRSSTTC
jgi:hypothetical protein